MNRPVFLDAITRNNNYQAAMRQNLSNRANDIPQFDEYEREIIFDALGNTVRQVSPPINS